MILMLQLKWAMRSQVFIGARTGYKLLIDYKLGKEIKGKIEINLFIHHCIYSHNINKLIINQEQKILKNKQKHKHKLIHHNRTNRNNLNSPNNKIPKQIQTIKKPKTKNELKNNKPNVKPNADKE